MRPLIKFVALALIGSVVAVTGVALKETVILDSHTQVRVTRAPGDGLDELATTRVVFGPPPALAACASWDVEENCCPAGCAAKNGSQWAKADDILRGCMRGLGCNEDDIQGATVFMRCDCDQKSAR